MGDLSDRLLCALEGKPCATTAHIERGTCCPTARHGIGAIHGARCALRAPSAAKVRTSSASGALRLYTATPTRRRYPRRCLPL